MCTCCGFWVTRDNIVRAHFAAGYKCQDHFFRRSEHGNTHEPLSASVSMSTSTLPSTTLMLKRPLKLALTPPTTRTPSVRPSATCWSKIRTASRASFSCLKVRRTVTSAFPCVCFTDDCVIGPHRLKIACRGRAQYRGIIASEMLDQSCKKTTTHLYVLCRCPFYETSDLHDVSPCARSTN